MTCGGRSEQRAPPNIRHQTRTWGGELALSIERRTIHIENILTYIGYIYKYISATNPTGRRYSLQGATPSTSLFHSIHCRISMFLTMLTYSEKYLTFNPLDDLNAFGDVATVQTLRHTLPGLQSARRLYCLWRCEPRSYLTKSYLRPYLTSNPLDDLPAFGDSATVQTLPDLD